MKLLPVSALAITLALSACVVPSDQQPREHPLGTAVLGTGAAVAPVPGEAWWNAFGDDQLDRLMQRALAENPTLAGALARVRQAGAMADAARAGLFPSLSFAAQETRQKFSGTDVVPPPYAGGTYWEGHQGLSFSWDLDFWGRQADLVRQRRSGVDAAAFDLAAGRLAVTGALVQAYIDLDRNHALADLADRTEAQRQHILDITRQRVRIGLDTNVELRQAESAVPIARVEAMQSRAAVELAVHQLAALSGQGAEAFGAIGRPKLDLFTVLPLPQALPADLLGRRPDLLAARARVEASTAGRDAAKAAFYPDVNLAAFAGTASIGFANLFQGAGGSYGIGPAIHLPLFDAGRLNAQLGNATAEIDGAVAFYNQAVLEAVRQSADQLSLIAALAHELDQQKASLDAAEAAYALAEQRYQAGLANYLTVLTAETQVLTARRDRIRLVSAQATARVALLLALGGSFNPQSSSPL